MEKRMYWLVSTVYEMPDIQENMDGKRIMVDLVRALEKRLKVKIKYFAEEKDGTWLYLIETGGVLGIYARERFEVKGHFVKEPSAMNFKKALTAALKTAGSKEMADEMHSSIVVVETGINGEVELY